MSVQAILLLFGVLLLLIAIIGGGFEVRELKIPKVEKTPRIISAVVGLVFILLGIIYNSITVEEPSVSQPAQLHQPGDIILGTWKEYGQQKSGGWEYLATCEVAKVNGSYTVSAVTQVEFTDIWNSIGIFDVQSDGTSWTFNPDYALRVGGCGVNS